MVGIVIQMYCNFFFRQFLRFFPEEFDKADQFVRLLQHLRLSEFMTQAVIVLICLISGMAELQGFFMFCKSDAEGVRILQFITQLNIIIII